MSLEAFFFVRERVCLESVFIECLFLYIFRERERYWKTYCGRHTVEGTGRHICEHVCTHTLEDTQWKAYTGRYCHIQPIAVDVKF